MGIPFNTLGSILKLGGEQALAKLLYQGASGDKIAELFMARFEPMLPSDRLELEEFSAAMIHAGDVISSLGPDDTLDLGIIPENSYLFGDESGGRRVRFAYEVEIEELERRISIIYDFPDVPSLTELYDIAEQELAERSNDSPGAFGVVKGETPTITNVIIPFAERKF